MKRVIDRLDRRRGRRWSPRRRRAPTCSRSTATGRWDRSPSSATARSGEPIEAFGQPGQPRSCTASPARCAGRGTGSGSASTTWAARIRAAREFGFFSNARAKGPHWKTNRGLKIGDGPAAAEEPLPECTLPFRRGKRLSAELVARDADGRRSGTGGRVPGAAREGAGPARSSSSRFATRPGATDRLADRG